MRSGLSPVSMRLEIAAHNPQMQARDWILDLHVNPEEFVQPEQLVRDRRSDPNKRQAFQHDGGSHT